MRIFVLLILTLLWFQGFTQIRSISSYIKDKYQEKIKFQRLSDIGGAIIGENESSTLMISHYRYRNVHYLSLELKPEDDTVGDTYDVLRINPEKGQAIIYRVCRTKGATNSKIVALAKYEGEEKFLKDIKASWIVNDKTLKFEEYDLTKVDCENLDYGL